MLFTAAPISATKKGLTFAVTTACLCTLSLAPLRICSPFFLLFPDSFPCQRRDPGSVTCDAPCDSHIARDEHRGHCLASRWQIVAFLPKARRMLVSSRHTESIFCSDCFLSLELRTATSQLLQAASPSRCRWKLQGHLDSWIHHAADLCICKSCSRVSGALLLHPGGCWGLQWTQGLGHPRSASPHAAAPAHKDHEQHQRRRLGDVGGKKKKKMPLDSVYAYWWHCLMCASWLVE